MNNQTPKPASFGQASRLLEFFKELNPTSEQLQKFFGAGDLVKQMLDCPDLSKIDRSAFLALLFSKPNLTIPWTPVGDYVDRIMKRSKLRGWGFTEDDAKKLVYALHDHFGDLYPTSVSMWLGKDLKFNWSELMLWIKDEVEALGYEFAEYLDLDRLSFFSGSEMSGKKSMDAVDLDLQTFWNPKGNGIVVGDEKPKRKKWPSLEVATLLALNPQVYIMMDGKTVPYMLAAGLVVDSGHLPNFRRYDREVYVDVFCDDSRWHYASMVSFREC